jgi:hypothetical protein
MLRSVRAIQLLRNFDLAPLTRDASWEFGFQFVIWNALATGIVTQRHATCQKHDHPAVLQL